MPNGYISAEDSLIDAFANYEYKDPQEYRQRWALEECKNRCPDFRHYLIGRQARKEHECVRGCTIQKHEFYFASTDFNMKFCVGCLAMVLYYRAAYDLQPHSYDHWDLKRNRPVLLAGDSYMMTLWRSVVD